MFNTKLKVQPFSDIHNYDLSFMPKKTDSDVLICAGDFDMGLNVEKWAKSVTEYHEKPLIIGLGNHDYWNTSSGDFTINEWEDKYRSFNDDLITFMNNETKIINGVAIIVATLWTDFKDRDSVCLAKSNISNDFKKIRLKDELIKPHEMYTLYSEARAYVISELEKHHDKKCIVVTHYPPSISCNTTFKITAPSYYWTGYMEDVISKYQPAAWVSGHMHNTYFNYFGNMQMILNPAGKIINGVSQNDSFKNDFTFNV